MNSLWIAYIAAALMVLVYKYERYVYQNRHRPRGEVTAEWFFENSADNASSWVATIGIVWMLGYLYVGQLVNLIPNIPVHPSIAFALGGLAEFIAPPVARLITATVLRFFERPTGG